MRICAVTGSRADWGLLKPVLVALRQADQSVCLIATGSHLEPAFGLTVDAVEADGFAVDRRVPLGRSDDSATGIAAALGRAVQGLTEALRALSPDLLLILGDRYEIFAAAQAAMLLRIPVAHIAGGDITEGAYDDAMRHAVTKLSHLHFTTNADAERRVRQLGESPQQVFLSGSPGIDNLLATARPDRAELQRRLGFRLRARNFAITFHPATLDARAPAAQLNPLLQALEQFSDIGMVFTGANADAGGAELNGALRAFTERHDNACFVTSLGQAGYYALVEQADLLIGNSSSGLYEAPSLHTPTLDIGMRQQGRLRGPSVVHADNDADAIATAIRRLLADPPRDFRNPYGDGQASARIVAALQKIGDPRALLVKRFHEVGG